MSLRNEIDQTFSAKAFGRPLFYSYPGGLRFELSEGGSSIEQFLLAMKKSSEVCTHTFSDSDEVVVCLKSWFGGSAFSYREMLAELKRAGVVIPKQREIWTQIQENEGSPKDRDCWLYLVFKASKERLQNLLWCALLLEISVQYGPIRDVVSTSSIYTNASWCIRMMTGEWI